MSEDELLNTIVESGHILKNLSQNRLKKIAKLPNLSHNELEQMKKMNDLPRNELKQIVKMKQIKNYGNMSKEELVIALLKLERSITELCKIKDNNAEIEETRKIFNEHINNFEKKRIKKRIKEN